MLSKRVDHIGATRGQSLRMWRVVSRLVRQRGQRSSCRMCLEWRLPLVGSLSWQASQRKVMILGSVGTFQSHFHERVAWLAAELLEMA